MLDKVIGDEKKIWKNILVISLIGFFIISCNVKKSFNTDYLDRKSCIYLIRAQEDTLLLDYHLVLDTAAFELSNIDTSRFSLYQSSYFAWHATFIGYKVLNVNSEYDYITVNWKSDPLLINTLFSITNRKTELNIEFKDTLHNSYVSYLVDSIPLEDYFIYNNILNKLYQLYEDPRLSWNYAYLISQYEKEQCGNPLKDVSYEVFVLLNIGIDASNLISQKKKELINHNHFFMHKCIPDERLLHKKFEKLNISNP
ncbi:MAG: hypothetical protein GXO89_04190 [Chlorobi bacterium]|nr:hypothetical protein [Chlorobiota bacterium]